MRGNIASAGADDIIAAIATPPGKGGIGVVRVSGKNLEKLVLKLLNFSPEPRRATLSKFLDDQGAVLDEGIALYFPAPHSYTGEDVLELQGHGGPAIVNLLLSSCLSAGARVAQPGEFTLRAFLNDKLDLVQAESVADVIDASTAEAARCALRSLQGEFSESIHTLVRDLIELRMLVEASLDFPEEEIDPLHHLTVSRKLESISRQVEVVFSSARQGNLLREGIWIVLTGQPNVGKSSLLNRLAGQEAAIVTEIPGTTRDVIHQTIELGGIPVHLLDTAGLRESDDPIEKIGMARTRTAIAKANLVLLLVDSRFGITKEDKAILDTLAPELPVATVFNKIDLLRGALPAAWEKGDPGAKGICISAKTGAGIEALREKLLEIAGWKPRSPGEGVFMARQRHLHALSTARMHLENATALMESEAELELLAEELGLAQRALSSITGEYNADDLLGEIFSRFCIGK
jgi:tRNA modification GTPase